MKEKDTLLLEKEVRVEQKLEKAKQKINLSSIQSQVSQPPQQENIVIETPNYDLIPETPPEKKKIILKLEKQVESQKPKKKTFKDRIVFGPSVSTGYDVLNKQFGVMFGVSCTFDVW